MKAFKKISLLVLLCITSVFLKAQSPSGLPLPNNPFGYYNIGWYRADSGNILANRQPNFTPLYPFTVVGYLNPGVDTGIWWSTGPSGTWYEIPKIGGGGGGGGITQLTGDGTTPTGGGVQPFTLNTVNVNVGSFGSASSVADFTVNGKGLMTAAGSIPIQIAESQVTNLVSDLASKQATITLGSTSQYFRGDLSLATFPTNLNQFTNGPEFISTISGIAAGGALAGTYPNPTLASVTTGGAGSCTNCIISYNAAGQILTAANGSSGGSQNLTYTQLATNNTLAISGGNTQTFLVATHGLAGLMDSASKAVVDSLRLRTYTWPTFPVWYVQGVSSIGTHGDSVQFGGSLGAFFQPDTLYTQYQGFYVYNLNDKSSLGAGDSVLILDANKQMRLVPSSAIGGGGGDVITSPNISLTIGGTSTNTTLDLNLAYSPTLTGTWTFNGGNILFGSNGVSTIGNSTNNAQSFNTHQVRSNASQSFVVAASNWYVYRVNTTVVDSVAATGQRFWPPYNSTTAFTGGTPIGLFSFDNSGGIWPITLGTNLSLSGQTLNATGGGGGGGIGVDSVQQITSGSSGTQTTGYNIVVINPSSTLSTYNLTTATTFHSSNDLYVVFGGTITSGPVVTTFTFTAGSGLTLIYAVNPSGSTYNAGEMIRFHKIGSLLYRYN